MYKIVRLSTGDLVFGTIAKKYSDMSLLVNDPRQVIIDNNGMVYLVPYNPFAAQAQELFNTYAIVSVSDAGDSLVQIYTEAMAEAAKPKKSKDSSALN